MKSPENKIARVQVVNIGTKNQKLLNLLYVADFDVVEVNGDACCSLEFLNQKIPMYDMVILLVGTDDVMNVKAATVVAETSRERGAITIGFFTENDLQNAGVDTLCAQLDSSMIVQQVVETTDDWLCQAMEVLLCFIGDMKSTDMIRLEFSDVSGILKNAGLAYMGMSQAVGSSKAEAATKRILSSLLQKTPIDCAQKALVYITGSTDIGLGEVETVATLIYQAISSDATLVLGAAFDEKLEDEIRISVIITGFETGH